MDKNDRERVIDAANTVGEVKQLSTRSSKAKKVEKQTAATAEKAIDMTLDNLFDGSTYLGADCSPLSGKSCNTLADFQN